MVRRTDTLDVRSKQPGSHTGNDVAELCKTHESHLGCARKRRLGMRTAPHASRVRAGPFARRTVVIGGALLAGSLLASSPGLAAASSAALSGVHVSGGDFSSPAAIASDGTHVWVANYDGNSVTELSARTGRLVKVISGSRYKFADPTAIASDGTRVWVPSESVTELNARTGRLVKVI